MDFSFERDIALIWLSIFCVLGLAAPILGLYFAVRAMNVAQKKSVELLKEGHIRVQQVRQQTERVSDRTAQPILRAQSQIAQAKTTLKKLAGRK